VCPSKCIDVVDETEEGRPRRRLVHHVDACIWCGQCERYCATQEGIKLGNEYDCVGFAPPDFEETVEKDLVTCELCGAVIAPADQLRWIADRLGPVTYANPTLLMTMARSLGIVDPGVRTDSPEIHRADRLKIHCPRCRRQTALSV
jgi:ferredoxin